MTSVTESDRGGSRTRNSALPHVVIAVVTAASGCGRGERVATAGDHTDLAGVEAGPEVRDAEVSDNDVRSADERVEAEDAAVGLDPLETGRPPGGFECDCDQPPSAPDGAPTVTGSFTLIGELSASSATTTTLESGLVSGALLTAIPAYVSDDPWPDIVASSAVAMGMPPASILYAQTADGVWNAPVPLEAAACSPSGCFVPTRCFALADLVGDPAWELVCLHPFGWFEGTMKADGTQRVLADPSHWHFGFTPESSVDEYLQKQASWSTPGKTIRFRDFDRDGTAEAILTNFDRDRGDYLLQRNSAGSFDASNFRQGMTFATCDVDLDGDLIPDAVYAFKEDGTNRPPNFNGMYRIGSDARGGVALTGFSPLTEGQTDPTGWFGAAAGSVDRTPMGCSKIPWLPGYYLSQAVGESAIIVPSASEGNVCDARQCIEPGSRAGTFVEHWGVTFTSWRGTNFEGVLARAFVGTGRNVTTPVFLALSPSGVLEVYGSLGDRDPVEGLAVSGAYYGLIGPFDYTGTGGKPDALFTLGVFPQFDRREPIRLFRNDLDPVGDAEILCLEIVGRGGESAIVRFDWEGGAAEQLVADGGQVSGSPPPAVFQGVVGPSRVTVRRPARPDEVFDAVEPGACYTLLPRSEDGSLPPPVRLR